jgi:hypothetical protein
VHRGDGARMAGGICWDSRPELKSVSLERMSISTCAPAGSLRHSPITLGSTNRQTTNFLCVFAVLDQLQALRQERSLTEHAQSPHYQTDVSLATWEAELKRLFGIVLARCRETRNWSVVLTTRRDGHLLFDVPQRLRFTLL